MVINPNDDDVIDIFPKTYLDIEKRPFKVKDFLAVIVKDQVIINGIECGFLSTMGGGWKKGKLRVRVEFIPDEPEPDRFGDTNIR